MSSFPNVIAYIYHENLYVVNRVCWRQSDDEKLEWLTSPHQSLLHNNLFGFSHIESVFSIYDMLVIEFAMWGYDFACL